MAYTYTASDDAILTIGDARRHIKALEKRVADIETSYAQVLEILADVVSQVHAHKDFDPQNEDMAKTLLVHASSIRENRRAATLNALADEAKKGAVDPTEGSEDFDHKQYLAELADAKADADYSDSPF